MKSKEKKTPQDDMSITDLLDVDDYINNSTLSNIQITNLPSSSNYNIVSGMQNGNYTAPQIINALFNPEERNYLNSNATTTNLEGTQMAQPLSPEEIYNKILPHHIPEVISVNDALALLEISEEDRQRLLGVKNLNIGDNKDVKALSEKLFKEMLKDIINTNTNTNSNESKDAK